MLLSAVLVGLWPSSAAAACGNGVQEADEACDDGGRLSGDGCDATCKLEPGWACAPATLEPSFIEVLYDEREYRDGFHLDPVWKAESSGLRVSQGENAKASIYGTSLGMNEQTVTLRVRAGEEDDDVLGIVIGYEGGDRDSEGADWLLIDWSSSDRRSADCQSSEGLAVSQVQGPITSLDDLWCHTGAVSELDRGNNFGLRGWAPNTTYTVKLYYTRTYLRITIDGQPELELRGRFPLGDLGFYALSQRDVSFELVSPAGHTACAGHDSDDDLIADPVEARLGLNPNDADSDGDGAPDAVELGVGARPLDTDLDGVINALDPDDDGDGVPSQVESRDGDTRPDNDDTDRDGIPDYLDGDDDGDGLATADEVYGAANPLLQDSDGDGLPDYVDIDDDGDGVQTRFELHPPLDSDGDGIPDYRDPDDDGDGVPTSVETWDGDNEPRNDDTDRDGIPDYLDPDDDGDGVPTAEETLDSKGTRDADGDGRPDHIDRVQQTPDGIGRATPVAAEPIEEPVAEEATVGDAVAEAADGALRLGQGVLDAAGEGAGLVSSNDKAGCGCGLGGGLGGGLALAFAACALLFARRRADPG